MENTCQHCFSSSPIYESHCLACGKEFPNLSLFDLGTEVDETAAKTSSKKSKIPDISKDDLDEEEEETQEDFEDVKLDIELKGSGPKLGTIGDLVGNGSSEQNANTYEQSSKRRSQKGISKKKFWAEFQKEAGGNSRRKK